MNSYKVFKLFLAHSKSSTNANCNCIDLILNISNLVIVTGLLVLLAMRICFITVAISLKYNDVANEFVY